MKPWKQKNKTADKMSRLETRIVASDRTTSWWSIAKCHSIMISGRSMGLNLPLDRPIIGPNSRCPEHTGPNLLLRLEPGGPSDYSTCNTSSHWSTEITSAAPLPSSTGWKFKCKMHLGGPLVWWKLWAASQSVRRAVWLKRLANCQATYKENYGPWGGLVEITPPVVSSGGAAGPRQYST